MVRGHVYDPVEPTKEPRWYEVRNVHRELLEARLSPPGNDLKRVFVAAMLEWIDAGRQLGELVDQLNEWARAGGAGEAPEPHGKLRNARRDKI